ncbi:MAG: hypothetical protein AB8I08_36795 [Sandaracinaceae bacterium]
MSLELDRPSAWMQAGLPLAFGLGCVHLVSETMGLGLPHPLESGLVVLGLTAAGMAWLAVSALRARGAHPDRAARRWREFWLVPCAMAPLSILSPWTIAPGHFGLGFGGVSFFLNWLTRYPTLGPVNAEVALGLGAVLGAGAVPAFFALYAIRARRLSPRVVALFVGLQLLAYLPVCVRLDVDLFLAPLLLPTPLALTFSAGALGRLLATLAMLGCWVHAVRNPTRSVTWE